MSKATLETKLNVYKNLIASLCEICDYFNITIRMPDGSYDNDKINRALIELIKFETIDVIERVDKVLIENVEECSFINEFNNMINDKLVEKCSIIFLVLC